MIILYRTRAGFTLVELLVVMALLSLIALGLGTTLHAFATAEQRINEHLGREDDLRIVSDFLRDVLSRQAVRKVHDDAVGGSRLEFVGNATSLSWVGVMPARTGGGGLHLFSLEQRPDEGGALLLQYVPYRPPADRRPADIQRKVLVDGVMHLEFGYADPLHPELGWLASWPHPDRLPARLLISVRRAGDTWPPIELPLRPLREEGQGGGGATFGPYVE